MKNAVSVILFSRSSFVFLIFLKSLQITSKKSNTHIPLGVAMADALLCTRDSLSPKTVRCSRTARVAVKA